MTTTNPHGLTRSEASAYLAEKHSQPISPYTLAYLARTGRGPGFVKVGQRVYHPPSELDKFAASRVTPVVHSTRQALEAKTRAEAET
jgi:hypothetical protein